MPEGKSILIEVQGRSNQDSDHPNLQLSSLSKILHSRYEAGIDQSHPLLAVISAVW